SLKKMEADLRRAEAGQDVGQPLDMLRTQVNALQVNADDAKDQTRIIGDKISELDEELRQVETKLREDMLWVPNIPHPTVPVGPDESHNVIHEPQGAPMPTFDFEPKPHWDLGVERDMIDFERGVKRGGSRFYLLKGWGARLQRSLIQFMLNYHLEHHGFTEIYPPFMVRSQVFEGAG
ncbi:MAG: serine--tRNA ligase, partial [Anaerolineales bacterium]|nr:serine--tRNA ligase [Anaerolineales bacterium]